MKSSEIKPTGFTKEQIDQIWDAILPRVKAVIKASGDEVAEALIPIFRGINEEYGTLGAGSEEPHQASEEEGVPK